MPILRNRPKTRASDGCKSAIFLPSIKKEPKVYRTKRAKEKDGTSVSTSTTLVKSKEVGHVDRPREVRFRCVGGPTTIIDAMKGRGWKQVDPEDDSWNLFWCEVTQVRSTLDDHRLTGDQLIPHFRNHYELTRKNFLARNLKRLRRTYQRQGRSREVALCDCMPTTFELPSEYFIFMNEYKRYPGATWILKPAMGCQGRGIFLFNRMKDFHEWKTHREVKPSGPFASNSPYAEPTFTESYVVQKYIETPYLIAGRKFDLRIYILVTAFSPLKVWIAREGFARLSGSKFSLDMISDHRVHLTNMSIQLKSSNEQRGCKWNLRLFREYLTAKHGSNVVEDLIQNIAQIVITSLQSVQSTIYQDCHCFELYGYDIILDTDLKPWLLEVNASPSLASTSQEDYKLKYDLLQDVFNVLDLERKLTGMERRVGGFDMLWNGGPVYASCPGRSDCISEHHRPAHACNRLNVFLGCSNIRDRQLNKIWQKAAFLKQSKAATV